VGGQRVGSTGLMPTPQVASIWQPGHWAMDCEKLKIVTSAVTALQKVIVLFIVRGLG